MFEDMETTNGSWVRLSKEGNSSEPLQICNNMIFKIGNSAMYKVTIPKNSKIDKNIGTISSSEKMQLGGGNKCYICMENERNCLLMPCRHNFGCIKCSKNLKKCPIDKEPIKELIKIYKS